MAELADAWQRERGDLELASGVIYCRDCGSVGLVDLDGAEGLNAVARLVDQGPVSAAVAMRLLAAAWELERHSDLCAPVGGPSDLLLLIDDAREVNDCVAGIVSELADAWQLERGDR